MSYNPNLEVTTLEGFYDEEQRRCSYGGRDQDGAMFAAQKIAIEEQRVSLSAFPYRLVTKGPYPANDWASKWCWQQFGPYQGECRDIWSEYPSCPQVLETGKYHYNPEWSDDDDEDVENEHSHWGSWKPHWLGKTGYDYGFMEWCFSSQEQLDAFRGVVETLGMGDQYQ